METQADTLEVRTFKVAGLNCIDCAGRIQASVKQLDGVENCQVDYATGDLTVWLTNPNFDSEPISTIVKKTGHNLVTHRNINHEININLKTITKLTLRRRYEEVDIFARFSHY